MNNPDLGTDLATLDDGDLNPDLDQLVDGPVLVAQDLRAELLTAAGTLFYDPDYGDDVRGMLGKRTDATTRSRVAARVQAVCLKDDRVATVDVTVTGSLVIEVSGLTSTQEPFRFVIDADAAAARLAEPR